MKSGVSLKITAAAAMLVAISIVCGKYLAFGVGNVLRFSLENLPIIFAGAAFGPLVGALVGLVADLVGCLLVGYAINPLVTVGAVAIGLISGYLWRVGRGMPHVLRCVVAVGAAHIVGSVIIKSFGLSVFYDMPLWMLMLWRLLNYTIVGTVEGSIIYFLMKNKMVLSEIGNIKRGTSENGEKNDLH